MPILFETVVLSAKDYFGDAIPDGRLEVRQKGVVRYSAPFVGGYLQIKVPLDLEPGLYDFVAIRGEAAEYTVPDVFVPFSQHFFRHAPLHTDLKLGDGNFADDAAVKIWKFEPTLSYRVTAAGGQVPSRLSAVLASTGAPDFVAEAARVVVEDGALRAEAGRALVGGRLVEWPDTVVPLPSVPANVGVFGDVFGVGTAAPDLLVGTVGPEKRGHRRFSLFVPRHAVSRQGAADHVVFLGQEADSGVGVAVSAGGIVSGKTQDGEVWGEGRSTLAVGEAEFWTEGRGPLLRAGDLLLERAATHALLWDGDALVAALPAPSRRAHFGLAWSPSLHFYVGDGRGYHTFRLNRPYAPAYPVLLPTVAPSLYSEGVITAGADGWHDTAGYHAVVGGPGAWEGSDDASTVSASASDPRELLQHRYVRGGPLAGVSWRREGSLVRSDGTPADGYSLYGGLATGAAGPLTPGYSLPVAAIPPGFPEEPLPYRLLELTAASPAEASAVLSGDRDDGLVALFRRLFLSGGHVLATALPTPDAAVPYNPATTALAPEDLRNVARRVAALSAGGSLTELNRRLSNQGLQPFKTAQDPPPDGVDPAPLVRWAWHVSAFPVPDAQETSWFDMYPGDESVSWVGLNVRHPASADPEQTVAVLEAFHAEWSAGRGKPMFVSYTPTPEGGDDPALLAALAEWTGSFPETKMLMLYGADFAPYPAVAAAASALSGDPRFVRTTPRSAGTVLAGEERTVAELGDYTIEEFE